MTPLLDTAQIAATYGLSRAYVTDRLTKRPDFPAPKMNLSRKLRRWCAREVARYMEGKEVTRVRP